MHCGKLHIVVEVVHGCTTMLMRYTHSKDRVHLPTFIKHTIFKTFNRRIGLLKWVLSRFLMVRLQSVADPSIERGDADVLKVFETTGQKWKNYSSWGTVMSSSSAHGLERSTAQTLTP